MDPKAFYSMSYGVYVTTSTDNGKPVGCITNSNTQITASPASVSVSVNHDNYTAKCIEKSGMFGFTALSEDSDPEIIGKFGFSSSKDTDKFSKYDYVLKEGIPVLTDGCAYVVCRVVDKMETETHTVFLGEVIDAQPLKSGEPMTYAYYHKVLKGKVLKKRLPISPTTKRLPEKRNSYATYAVIFMKGITCLIIINVLSAALTLLTLKNDKIFSGQYWIIPVLPLIFISIYSKIKINITIKEVKYAQKKNRRFIAFRNKAGKVYRRRIRQRNKE